MSVLVLLLLVALGNAAPILMPSTSGDLLDMTYTFDNDTIYWPSLEANGLNFRLTTVHRGPTEYANHTYHIEILNYQAGEHGGTHIDAPKHFIDGGASVDELPLQSLIGPALRIDISQQAANNTDYVITRDDVLNWESANGGIEEDDIVFIFADWGRRWGNRSAYVGNDRNDVNDIHFPALGVDAARLLVERRVRAVGMDTLSPDNFYTGPFAHQTLLSEGIVLIENVANLDRLPTRGASVFGLPMKIGGGTGAPLRLVAVNWQ